MDQITRLFASLTLRQKLSLLVAAIAVGAGLMAFLRWNTERDFAVLYSNLSSEDASAVVAKLHESGAEYRLSDDGTVIKVRSASVADMRLQMAGAGLPKSGRIGYELFDQTNFGATEFAEQVNYQRALEGELERTVMALSEIESARVHLTQPKDSVFLENRRPAKASVLVKLRPGAQLSPQNVQAITHLVSSAVEGLDPEMVSLLDVRGNLLNRPRHSGGDDSDAPSEATLDYRRGVERDLLTKINATLDPLLGPDKYRTGVSVDVDFTSGDQSEEVFDPTRAAIAVSQRTEDVSGAAQASGVPGTASNLPRPTSKPASASQGVARRTENITYQTTRQVKHTKLPQGAVKRMSISVLVDHTVRWEGEGAKAKRIVEPPSPERLKTTRDLVAGIVGLQPDRGDQLIVETLPFESTLTWEPPGAMPAPVAAPTALPLPGWLTDAIEKKNWIVIGAAAGVGLLLLLAILFVLVKTMRGRKRGEVTSVAAIPSGKGAPAVAEGPGLDQQIEQRIASQLANRQKQEQEILSSLNLKLPSATSKKTEVLARQLAEEAKKDQTTLPQVVRTWMSDQDS